MAVSGKFNINYGFQHNNTVSLIDDVNDSAQTNGEIIDLYEQCECEASITEADYADHLFQKFKRIYPHIYIGRPRRFYERVQQIVAPTRPSLKGESCLKESDAISSYREKVWKPRIRTFAGILHICIYACFVAVV